MSLGAVLYNIWRNSVPQLLSIFPKNSTWRTSFPVLTTSLKQFLIFMKLMPLCLKAISFYVNGAQILPCFKRRSKIITPVHSLPPFPFWDVLGSPKRTRFRSPTTERKRCTPAHWGLENRRMEYSKSRCQNSDPGKILNISHRKMLLWAIYGDLRLTK